MAEPATANADDVPDDRPGAVPDVIGVTRAAALLGAGQNTVRRRVDAWVNGDRTDYAIAGGMTGHTRTVNFRDALALAAQRRGDLGPGRHDPANAAAVAAVVNQAIAAMLADRQAGA